MSLGVCVEILKIAIFQVHAAVSSSSVDKKCSFVYVFISLSFFSTTAVWVHVPVIKIKEFFRLSKASKKKIRNVFTELDSFCCMCTDVL
jgi:hypothetical protein